MSKTYIYISIYAVHLLVTFMIRCAVCSHKKCELKAGTMNTDRLKCYLQIVKA